MISVIILGCGPEAILAAHAAASDGCDVRIFAPEKRAQFIVGPDHLTHNVPGLCRELQPGSIEYRRLGERGSYGNKVYKNKTVVGMWDQAEGVHPLYSLRNAYTAGWMRYHELIEVTRIDAKTIGSVSADIVINTLPAPLLCQRPKTHRFSEREIWRSAMPVHGQTNRIVYASSRDIEWYCWSVIENISTWEFTMPPAFLRNQGQLSQVIVPGPSGTDCDCLPDVTRVGRNGKWDDLVRPHQAYLDTRHLLGQTNQESFISGDAA